MTEKMTPQADALKPCPFCGAAAHFEMDADRWEWVACESCGMQGNRSASLGEDCKPRLREAWNRRAAYCTAEVVGEVVSRGALGGKVAQLRSGLPVGTKLYALPGACNRCSGRGWVMFGLGASAGAEECPECVGGEHLGHAATAPCRYCDGTGDVHGLDGQWRGECKQCDAAQIRHDAVDAERYRWLRDKGRHNGWCVESQTPGWGRIHSASSLDAALDAARTTQQGAQHG